MKYIPWPADINQNVCQPTNIQASEGKFVFNFEQHMMKKKVFLKTRCEKGYNYSTKRIKKHTKSKTNVQTQFCSSLQWPQEK